MLSLEYPSTRVSSLKAEDIDAKCPHVITFDVDTYVLQLTVLPCKTTYIELLIQIVFCSFGNVHKLLCLSSSSLHSLISVVHF